LKPDDQEAPTWSNLNSLAGGDKPRPYELKLKIRDVGRKRELE
jgi:hypothetical protein